MHIWGSWSCWTCNSLKPASGGMTSIAFTAGCAANSTWGEKTLRGHSFHVCCNLFHLFPSLLLFFSLSVMSDSLWPHGLQQASHPCPSPSPGTCSDSWLLSWWCHPTICPLSSSSSAFVVCVVTQFSPNQLWCSVAQSTQPTCTRWMTSSCFLSVGHTFVLSKVNQRDPASLCSEREYNGD